MSDIVREYKKLLDSFQDRLKSERLNLPYHINVIDELHINENAHSRILLKLLQYRDNNGEYLILKSLIEYIVNKSRYDQFKRINFTEPVITQEESRIDLWIRDNSTGYSIIFENKVYNAIDRDAQLSRYIEKTINKGFKEQNIFIVYLSSSGQEPDEYSWGNYKTTFKNRYINISFKNDILAWLKEDVFSKIHPTTDIYLISALNQYIDYLEGYFQLRKIDEEMYKNLDNLILEHFGLDRFNDHKERIKVLQVKMNEMQELIKHMDSFKDRLNQQIFEEWKKKIKDKFSNFAIEEQNGGIEVCLNLDGKEFLVRIDIDKDETLYCQIISKDYSCINDTRVMELHKTLLPEPKEPNIDIWKHFGDDYDKAFDHFCTVIEACKNLQSE